MFSSIIFLISYPPRATVDVTVKPASGQSGPGERLLEELVGKTCETMARVTQHPHTAISITLQVERSEGSVSVPAFLALDLPLG